MIETVQPEGWVKPKGYANGMAAEGRLVVTGGVIGWDNANRLADGFVAQVRQTLENIVAILAAGGAGPQHLVRLTWYVVDKAEYLAAQADIGAVWRERIGRHYPTMAVVVEPEMGSPCSSTPSA